MVAVSVAFQTDQTAFDHARLAVLAEERGFDGVSVFHDFGFPPSLFPLLEIARVTSRVRLGAACLNPYLLHPVEIAGQAVALQQASHGRAYVGIARGAWLERVGVVADRPLRRLAEAVEVVRRLLRGDDSGYDGTIYPLAPGARLLYSLPTPVSILIGAWGARATALAARVADEQKLGGCANPDMVRLARARLDDAGGSGTGLVAGAVTVVDQDGAAARSRARSEVAKFLDVVAPFDTTVTVPDAVLTPLRAALAAGADAGRFVPDDLLHRFAFAGTPSEVATHAASLAEAGAARIEFGGPHGLDAARGVDLLGRHVLPALRDLS